MKHKYALFPLIAGAIFLLGFVWLYISSWNDITPLWLHKFILAVPGVILLFIGYRGLKGKWGRGKTCLWTAGLLPVFLVYLLICIFLLACVEAEGTRDLKDYGKAYERIGVDYDVKSIFPEEISENAREIEFFYCPLFMQQGEIFTLFYNTTPEEIEKWETALKSEAQWVGPHWQWEKIFRGYNVVGKEGEATRYHLYWDGEYRGEMCYVLINRENASIYFYWAYAP